MDWQCGYCDIDDNLKIWDHLNIQFTGGRSGVVKILEVYLIVKAIFRSSVTQPG
jgi:hypothetical protein